SSLSIPTSFLFCSHASPLTLILLTPNDADRIQLARDRPPRALELAGDLVVREAFHLPNRDSRQSVVAEAIEQALLLFGALGREGGRGLAAPTLGDSGLLPLRSHPRFAVRRATATPLRALARDLFDGFARRDDDQKPPEIVAVVEVGKTPPR